MIYADVRTGTKRDAILYSVSANDAHGLRRSNEDKRKAVLTLLNDGEWARWSDSEIARRCAVHHSFVGDMRKKSLAVNASEATEVARTFNNKHGTVSIMRTENIGKKTMRGQAGAKAEHSERISELARKGHNAEQIADEIGITEKTVRKYAVDASITLPEHIAGRAHRINHRRVIEETVLGLEASAASLRTLGVSFKGIDPTEAADWAKSMTESLRALTALRNQLKEHANGKD